MISNASSFQFIKRVMLVHLGGTACTSQCFGGGLGRYLALRVCQDEFSVLSLPTVLGIVTLPGQTWSAWLERMKGKASPTLSRFPFS